MLNQEKNVVSAKRKSLSFREAIYLWLENNRLKLKDQTLAKYQRLIESHIIPFMGSISVKSIDISYINRFILAKSTDGRIDKQGGLAPSYVRSLVFIIKSVLCFASMNGYCSQLNQEIILPVRKKATLEVLSISEQCKLEQNLSTDISDKELGVFISLYTGLRIGEVCGITWGDIDFESATLHVRHTVERIANLNANVDENKTKLVLSEAKTVSSDRIIPIPSRLMPFLKNRRKKDQFFVLQGCSYPYIDPRSLQYFFQTYLEKHHMRYVNYHALRHTFATRCIESGMDIKSLSEILGHSSVNITLNTYVHSSMEHKRKQLEAMTAICGQ